MPGLGRKEELFWKTRRRMAFFEKNDKKAKVLLSVGGGLSAAFDPIIGGPIVIPGLIKAIGSAAGRYAIRKRLLKNPRTAGYLAKRFKDTEQEKFFSDIVFELGKNRRREMMKKYAGLHGTKKIPLRTGLKKLFAK